MRRPAGHAPAGAAPACTPVRPAPPCATAASGNSARGGVRAVARQHGIASPPPRAGRPAAPSGAAVGAAAPSSASATGRAKPARCSSPAHVAQLGEGRDARRQAAAQLRSRPRPAPRAAPAASPRPGSEARNSPSGAQRAADLHQRAGQVVHPVQREAGDHQVEALRREGQPFLVRRDRRARRRRAAMRGERSAETTKGMPRARSRGATTPRPPRSSARVKRRVVSSSRSSSRSAASSRMGRPAATVAAARSRRRRTRRRSKTRAGSLMRRQMRPCAPRRKQV